MLKKNILAILCISTVMLNPSYKIHTAALKANAAVRICKNESKMNTVDEKTLPLPRLDESINESKLSRKEENWYFRPQKNGIPSGEPKEFTALTHKYYGYISGDTSRKVIYLTFDEGYEYGLTPKFLDILKENNVKAAFFVTATWIKSQPELSKRMVDEGHYVCNHTTTHPSMAKITNKDKFTWELQNTDDVFKSITGTSLKRFFRPPMGKFSELSLYYTASLGYRTIFWSVAYKDWDVKNQKDVAFAKDKLLSRAHNGAIYLLHAESKTNAEILDSVIKELKSQGYSFETLDTLPEAPL